MLKKQPKGCFFMQSCRPEPAKSLKILLYAQNDTQRSSHPEQSEGSYFLLFNSTFFPYNIVSAKKAEVMHHGRNSRNHI